MSPQVHSQALDLALMHQQLSARLARISGSVILFAEMACGWVHAQVDSWVFWVHCVFCQGL